MPSPPANRTTTTSLLFTTAWRALSHAACPTILPSSALDANGLIRRSFCPDLIDEVERLIRDMGAEAQYAVWSWTCLDEDKAWHPTFVLPENRRVVVKLGARKAVRKASGTLLGVPEER